MSGQADKSFGHEKLFLVFPSFLVWVLYITYLSNLKRSKKKKKKSKEGEKLGEKWGEEEEEGSRKWRRWGMGTKRRKKRKKTHQPSLLSSAPNNPHAKVTHFGIKYSAPTQHQRIFYEFNQNVNFIWIKLTCRRQVLYFCSNNACKSFPCNLKGLP